MLRSTVAVVVGFLFTGVAIILTTNALHGAMPVAYPPAPARIDALSWLAIETGIVAIFAVAGCWLTARLAPARPMRHALISGAIAFAMSIPQTMTAWEQRPAWYNLLNLMLVLPLAWLGGRIRTAQTGEA